MDSSKIDILLADIDTTSAEFNRGADDAIHMRSPILPADDYGDHIGVRRTSYLLGFAYEFVRRNHSIDLTTRLDGVRDLVKGFIHGHYGLSRTLGSLHHPTYEFGRSLGTGTCDQRIYLTFESADFSSSDNRPLCRKPSRA